MQLLIDSITVAAAASTKLRVNFIVVLFFSVIANILEKGISAEADSPFSQLNINRNNQNNTTLVSFIIVFVIFIVIALGLSGECARSSLRAIAFAPTALTSQSIGVAWSSLRAITFAPKLRCAPF
jgi:hypothetical protein